MYQTFGGQMIELHNCDCLEIFKGMEENSIDAIVTDPPYELGFMGKSWDNTGIANSVDMWREALRVLKPGGHLLAFGGTRTYHRMASAIEDAGFEVRDMIEWVYGSGFPKSLNIGKAVDKLQGNEREVLPNPKAKQQTAAKDGIYGDYEATTHISKGTSEYEGWGTALKPAHEPICMARKPLSEKTVAENCLKWGTGGINIDESRVGYADGKVDFNKIQNGKTLGANSQTYGDRPVYKEERYQKAGIKSFKENGRFPANLIHDNSEEVRECFPETKSVSKDGIRKAGSEYGQNSGWNDHTNKDTVRIGHNDSGNASRFFKSIPNKVVDLQVSSMYNRGILINIKEKLCGQHLTKKKTGIMLDGVILEVEKFIQDAELLMSGNSTMEKFLTDIVSTTKTLTQQMTELKILNVLPNWLITKFTEDSEKTIKSLKELNTEDVKNAESMFPLITFINEVLESIRVIAESAVEMDLNNGEKAKDNSRFFKSIIYQAKASRSERNKGCEDIGGNKHCTVKPIALMEYLINMVTREGQIILDPFMGSGTTGVACVNTGRDFIGIEKEKEYCDTAEKKIESHKLQLNF